MDIAVIISAKHDGRSLDRASIVSLIESYTRGDTSDEEMTVFARAVFDNGMDAEETCYLTEAMLNSGDRIEFSVDGNPVVDKHSTGGIGDKVSLVLAPLLACLERRVPMLSGRSLGFTGGTLDKLESIPGFRSALSLEEIVGITDRVGCVICGATEEIAPADRKLYALRDRTGTIGSIPLITASILSKKLAETPDGLIFDVKTGRGAFMAELDAARTLARSLVDTSRLMGVPARALITDMNQPVGTTLGNTLEVQEAMRVLSGAVVDGLTALTLRLAREALALTGTAMQEDKIANLLASGRVAEKFEEMVSAQGGRLDEVPDVSFREVLAVRDGIVVGMDGVALGNLVNDAAGTHTDRPIDHETGIRIRVRIGDEVRKGDVIALVAQPSLKEYTGIDVERVAAAIDIAGVGGEIPPLIHEIIE